MCFQNFLIISFLQQRLCDICWGVCLGIGLVSQSSWKAWLPGQMWGNCCLYIEDSIRLCLIMAQCLWDLIFNLTHHQNLVKFLFGCQFCKKLLYTWFNPKLTYWSLVHLLGFLACYWWPQLTSLYTISALANSENFFFFLTVFHFLIHFPTFHKVLSGQWKHLGIYLL